MIRIIYIFSFLILASAYTHSYVLAYAQEGATSSQKESKQEYFLPYPGILPDNPLYIFKEFRDGIIGLIITSPNKQAEFDLQRSDKMLQSAVLLIQKDTIKYRLAYTSLLKSNKYFSHALSSVRQAKKEKYVMIHLSNKLISSAQKHEEVIKEIGKKVPSDKNNLERLVKEMEDFEKSAYALAN